MKAGTGSRLCLLPAIAIMLTNACSSDGSDATRSTATNLPTTSRRTITTTVEQVVLDGYRAAWGAYNAATAAANPDEPGLPARMTAEQVQVVRTYVIGLKAQGLVSKGELELHPRVVDLTATSATVLDCYRDTTKNYDAATGELKDTSGAKTFSARVTMALEGDTWKMAKVVTDDAACANQ
jgi:hypothetical protein